MPDNVAASMTASIVLDKSDLLAQILKGLSEGQKELQNNKLEMYFDFSNSKNQAEFEKVIQKYRKQLSSQEFVVQIKDQGIDETVKSLDKLVEVVKSLASGKAFGTGLGNGKGIGNSIVDEKQLKTVINLFEKMESHLSSMRKVISDVGDGDEFSPLLTMINRVDSSISELAKKTSNLNLNMNLDFGSDDKITAEVQSRTAKLLHTYENLFNRLKMSGTLDSNMQGYFDNFDINQYDNMNAKIAAYKNFITEMREMSKQQFGKDYLYSDIEKSYYSAVSGAQRSLNNVIKSESTSNNSIENLFGKTDLSEVISQLTIIVNKLDEISTSANNFTNVFKNGLDVNTSIQEVIDLTNRVKELETELAKIKNVTPATVSPASETNISSGSDSAIEQQIKQQDKLQDEIRETIALTNEYGEVIDVYRGTHGLIGNGNVSNRYHGGTFWTSNRKLATQSYADGNKVTHANLYMRNPYLVHGGGADWDQLTLSIKQGEELEKHLENVYASINDVFSKIQDTSGIEAGHLFDVFDGQLNFTDFENGIQKPIESLKDFQNIFESIDYDNSKIPQVQNYINQLYDLFTSYSRISQLSEKGVLNTNEVVEIAKALKYDGVVFNGIRDGSDDSSDIFVTFEEKQSKVIDMITAAQLRVEEEQQLANILVNTRENLYKTLKSLDSKQVDEFIDKSAFNFVTDGSYMENLGEVLGKADPTDSIDNIKNKIREYINEVVNEFENAQKQIADSTEPTKDAFPDKDVSASVEKIADGFKEVKQETEEATESAKDYVRTISQVGEWNVDSKVSVVKERNDGQLETWNYDAKRGKKDITYDKDGNINYGDPIITTISNYKQLEQTIVKADDKLRDLRKALEDIKEINPNASTKNIEKQIQYQKEYISLLEQTVKIISQGDEYFLNEQQIIDARKKATTEYDLKQGTKSDISNAKQSAKANEQAIRQEQKLTDELRKQEEQARKTALSYTESASKKLSNAISKYSYGDSSDATAMMKQMNRGLSNFGDLSNIESNIKNFDSVVDSIITDLKRSHEDALSSLNSEIKAEETMQKQKDAFNKSNLNAIDMEIKKREEEAKAFSNSLKAQMESQQQAESQMSKFGNTLSKYQTKTSGYDATIARFNDGGWTSDTYLKNVQAVRDAVKQYATLLDNIKTNQNGIASDEDIQNLDKYEKKIKDTIATVANMSASEKGYSQLAGQKEIDKINKILRENSAMSSEAKAKIKAYKQELISGNPSASLEKIHGEIMKIVNAEELAGRTGRSFFDTLKNSGFHQLAAQMAGMFGFYDVINVIKQAASTVTELNTQITELAKVSEQSSKQIYADFDSYADIAKEVRGTISDTIAATADWSKNGYSIPDAKQLAEISQLYKNVGDGIDIDAANESLISTLKGFQLEADQAEHIVDVFNEVSKNIGEVA